MLNNTDRDLAIMTVSCQDPTYVRSTVSLAISAMAQTIANQALYAFKMPTMLQAGNASLTGTRPHGTLIGTVTSACKIVSEARIAVGKQAIGMNSSRLTSSAAIRICLISVVDTESVFLTWTFISVRDKTARIQGCAEMTWYARRVH